MRLHTLELEAFGPYPGREHIDFDALDDAGIVLVNGPTGSGKTSLLDAIAFALYGDVAGSRRTLRDTLRSHHAAPGVPARVALEFSAASRKFRIERSPAFHAPKKRGQGTTKRHASVVLTEFKNGQWHAVATRLDEAGDVVKDVLGMDLEQFSQVVLLPQGEFAQFLRAAPEERRRLLEKLFDVQRFELIEEWFVARRSSSRQQVDAAQGLIRALLTTVVEQTARLQIPELSAPDWSPAGAAQLPEQLRSLLSEVRTGRDIRDHNAERARAVHRSAQRALSSMQQRQERMREAETALAMLERWPATTLKAEQHRLDVARRAATVVRRVHRYRVDLAEHEEATRALTELEDELAARMPGDLATWRSTREHAAGLLTQASSLSRNLTYALSQLVNAHERVEADTAKANSAQADVEKSQQELDAARKKRQMLADEVAAAPDWPLIADLARRLVEATRKLHESHVAVDDAATALKEARKVFSDAERFALQLREKRLANMSGELAATLAEGSPCPVCGSPEHPAPAELSEEAPTDDDIEQAEKAAATARTALTRAEATHSAAQATRSAHDSGVASMNDELKPHRNALGAFSSLSDSQAEGDTELDPEATSEAARNGLAAHRELLERCDRASLHAEQATRAASRAEQMKAQCEARLEAAIEAQANAERSIATQFDDVRTTLNEWRATPWGQRLGEPVVQPSASEREVGPEPWREAVTELGNHLSAAQRSAAEDDRALSRHEAATQRVDRANNALDLARTALDEELHDQKFESVEDAEKSSLDPDELASLGEEVEAATLDVEHAKRVLARQEIQLAMWCPSPNVAALEHRASVFERRSEAAMNERAEWQSAYNSLEGLRNRIVDAVRDYLPLADQAREFADLADTVTGLGENTLRMRLTNYVLAARLEEVTAMANERLARMSDGRFQLEYSDERASHGKVSGLGLRVRDAWTGVARDTSTLSGGEAFMASLALALGLGDAVRAQSGGLSLHTLFVDEGFGSLDQDTLEQVMEVLDDLREGGRLVGIVSHVTELRARIPTHIEVLKTAEGSTLRVTTSSASS